MVTQIRLAVFVAAFVTLAQTAIQVWSGRLFAQQTQTPPLATVPQSQPAASVQSPQASAGQTLSPEAAEIESKVRPSVIWVTAFDPKGNLLRTETGFFMSADGRFVATAHAIEGAVNAVAKMADGGIYNVSGVVAASKGSDISVLQAEVKPRKLLRFLDLNKTGELTTGAKVTVVGSALAGNEGAAHQTTITAQTSDRLEIADAIPASSVGSPVVNENGDVVGK